MEALTELMHELKSLEGRTKDILLSSIIVFAEDMLKEGKQINPKFILEFYAEVVEEVN